jgi:hypothetical protein
VLIYWHVERKSMAIQSQLIGSRLGLADAQQRYDDVIGDFPV